VDPLQAGDPGQIGSFRLLGCLGEGGTAIGVILADAAVGQHGRQRPRPRSTGDEDPSPAAGRRLSSAAAAARDAC
jgi:hypothetical protein